MSKLKDRYIYPALFSYDSDGISISFPDLPGCFPCADTDNTDMAIRNAKEALGLHMWGIETDNETIPTPTPIQDLKPDPGEIPILIDVFMPPIRDKIATRFVKKTLSLPAWLAAEADENGVNCSRIFQNALIEYLHGSTQERSAQ